MKSVFVLTSDFETRHIQEALINTYVSGSVVMESDIPTKVQGLQFEGKLRILEQALANKAKQAYLKRFPMSALQNTTLWFLEVSYLKYTDNRLGHGNKLVWKR
ncbi:MAG: hypothetical protein HC905_23540 [Bacteroidales bacterium]|nr:hypothetical protein [Bacteroidales bacterium]